MTRTNYAGIDYGLGQSNIDNETGIRYGIISRHSLADWFEDEIEPVYIARCPECGSKNIEETLDHEDNDNQCKDCSAGFSEDETIGDEADYWQLRNNIDGVECHLTNDGTELFVTKSPVCITAQFCSPCVPGAGNLDCPCESGPLTYALPLDWLRKTDEYHTRAYEQWDLISAETRQAVR